eukprot:gene5586-5825_t
MGANGTLTFSFKIAPKARHGVLVTLRSVGAEAVMRLISEGLDAWDSTIVYFNDAVTESIIRVRAAALTPGQYTLVVQGTGGASSKMLIYLRNPDEDICQMGPFVCNEDGHLEKIDFSNAGLQCKRFPPAFGQFPALETLMLRYNDFNGDEFNSVAQVFSKSTAIRRLMLGATNLTGTVPCDLFTEHNLRTVMFSINKLEGSLPGCVLESTSLEELYMSRTTLTGELPDVIPADSNLRVWYSINQDPQTGDMPGPGFSGTIPSSLSNAAGLAFVELSSHSLTGDVPQLPAGIRMFEAFSNQLDGSIASPLPRELIYFDLMNNSLTGAVPDFSECTDLTLVDLSQNELTGQLPVGLGGAGTSLAYLDVSNNSLDGNTLDMGTIWERAPALQFAFAQSNQFEGPVPASLAASRNLVALDMSNNRLSGNLNSFADQVPAESNVQGDTGVVTPVETPVPGDTTPAVEDPAAGGAPGSAELPVTGDTQPRVETPAPGGATTTTVGPDTPTAAVQDPAASAPAAASQTAPDLPLPTAAPGPVPEPMPSNTRPTASSSGQPLNDIGLVSMPTSSALAGNAFLYLNVSHNALTGDIPESLGNLEMFRSPANSTDPYDIFITRVGSHSRYLDLTHNQLYGPFPRFLIEQPPELSQACRCRTRFAVNEGNFLYCPTKAELGGLEVTGAMKNALERQNYTCMTETNKPPVSLVNYLSKADNYITEPPAAPVFEPLPPRESSTRAVEAGPGSAQGASDTGSGKPNAGAIAGAVIGGVVGAAIIGCLIYFVGYKRFWQDRRATSFKRGEIPDGPGMQGHGGEYPAAAYGPGAGNGVNGFGIESSGPARV